MLKQLTVYLLICCRVYVCSLISMYTLADPWKIGNTRSSGPHYSGQAGSISAVTTNNMLSDFTVTLAKGRFLVVEVTL